MTYRAVQELDVNTKKIYIYVLYVYVWVYARLFAVKCGNAEMLQQSHPSRIPQSLNACIFIEKCRSVFLLFLFYFHSRCCWLSN